MVIPSLLHALLALSRCSALLEPPGSYCAYGCLYCTMCVIKLFNIATQTFEEQHK